MTTQTDRSGGARVARPSYHVATLDDDEGLIAERTIVFVQKVTSA